MNSDASSTGVGSSLIILTALGGGAAAPCAGALPPRQATLSQALATSEAATDKRIHLCRGDWDGMGNQLYDARIGSTVPSAARSAPRAVWARGELGLDSRTTLNLAFATNAVDDAAKRKGHEKSWPFGLLAGAGREDYTPPAPANLRC